MQGTEKQVKWAKDIKAQMMMHINPMADALRAKHAGNPKIDAMLAQVMAVIDSRDAAYWIDNRIDQPMTADMGAPLRVWQEAVKECMAGK